MSVRAQQRVHRFGGLLLGIILGSLALVVIAIAFMFMMSISGNIFTTVAPTVGGVGGATTSDISTPLGDSWKMFGAMGALVIPAALFLVALLGGRGEILSRERPRPPRRGPPL